MLTEDACEELIEDNFLESVFGAKSRLENDQWLKAVAEKHSRWVFTVDEMRNKILEVSKVEKKH